MEGTYRDRVPPEIGELHRRLRRAAGQWRPLEVQALVSICARDPDVYHILPPMDGAPPKVFFQCCPAWFKGWVDVSADGLSGCNALALCEDLVAYVAATAADGMPGGTRAVAHVLFGQKDLPPSLRCLTLGEIFGLLNFALSEAQRVLVYDPSRGHVLRLRRSPGGASPSSDCGGSDCPGGAFPACASDCGGSAAPSTADNPAVCEPVARCPGDLGQVLRLSPVPAAVASAGEARQHLRSQALRSCVESLYRDRLEPTLPELRGRLRESGWSIPEVNAVPALLARDAVFQMLEPDGCRPLRVHLSETPAWFEGWIGEDTAPVDFPDEVWASLVRYLAGERGGHQRTGDVWFRGGIRDAALSLRQSALPHLQRLCLAELRELVGQAVGSRKVLTYDGDMLRPYICTSQP